MGRRDEDVNEGTTSSSFFLYADYVFWSKDWCAGSGRMRRRRFPRRRWSSGCLGSPSVWAPCPATAGGRLGAARSSRGCWSLFVAWKGHNQCRRWVKSQTSVFVYNIEGNQLHSFEQTGQKKEEQFCCNQYEHKTRWRDNICLLAVVFKCFGSWGKCAS